MEKMHDNAFFLPSHIEHTLLRQDCTLSEIEELCHKAIDYQVAAVCIPPFFTSHASRILGETPVSVVSVVGFPMGYSNITAKADEAKKVISDGADEVDMVMNIAAFKSGLINHVADGIEAIKTLCGMNDKLLKVIIETGVLTDDEIKRACDICVEKEVDFVKTSTGFAPSGANPKTISLMRAYLPENIKIKASGGIKSKLFALELIQAGADRIGTSSGFAIIDEI